MSLRWLVGSEHATPARRAGEPAGVAGWLEALQGGRRQPTRVAAAFLGSDEFYNQGTR